MNFFDLHCDTAYECYFKNKNLGDENLGVSFKKISDFKNWSQTFAIWIKDDVKEPWSLYKNILNNLKKEMVLKPDRLTPYYSVEGGALLENDIDRLYELKKDEIKILTLTWNGENNIAGGVTGQKGLTEFGKKVIKEMNILNLCCDVSHLNEKSFYGVIDTAKKVIATHSNCYEICENKRNLKLEQIKLLTEKGGVLGLNFYPLFLGENIFEKIYRNIFLLCDKGYEDFIAIGSDFDGAKMDKKLNGIDKISSLYSFLEGKGLKKDLLNKIFYENANNFIAKL